MSKIGDFLTLERSPQARRRGRTQAGGTARAARLGVDPRAAWRCLPLVAQSVHLSAGCHGDRRPPARPRYPDARCRTRAVVRGSPPERMGWQLALRLPGVHEPLGSTGPTTFSITGSRSRPRTRSWPVRRFSGQPHQPAPQDRARPHRPDWPICGAASRSVPRDGARRGAARHAAS